MPIRPNAKKRYIRLQRLFISCQRHKLRGGSLACQQMQADQPLIAVLAIGRNLPVIHQCDADLRPGNL